MKKIYKIFIFFSSTILFSQEYKKDLYLLIDNNTQIIAEGNGYTFTLYIKSKDQKFSHDVYTFYINNDGFEIKPLKDLAKPISIDTLNLNKQFDFFNNNSACQSHEELSLKRIFLVKEVQKENKSNNMQYRCWPVIYAGTQKDIIKTSPDFSNKKYFEE
jgi:hypothetical protein